MNGSRIGLSSHSTRMSTRNETTQKVICFCSVMGKPYSCLPLAMCSSQSRMYNAPEPKVKIATKA